MWLPLPAEVWRGAMPSLVAVLAQVVLVALVEKEMTAHDRKFGGRTITLSRETAKLLEQYQKLVNEEFGQDVPYNLTLAIAIKRAIAARKK